MIRSCCRVNDVDATEMHPLYFLNDAATTEISALPLHAPLPIAATAPPPPGPQRAPQPQPTPQATSARVTQPPPPQTARQLPERSEEHTSELQSRQYLVCRLLLEKHIGRLLEALPDV